MSSVQKAVGKAVMWMQPAPYPLAEPVLLQFTICGLVCARDPACSLGHEHVTKTAATMGDGCSLYPCF